MNKYKKGEKCIKCGSKDIAISYHEGRLMGDCEYNQKCRWEEKEHLSHYCRTCGYDWATKCIN